VASSNKRQRQLARAHYQALQEKRATQAAARRRRQQIVGGFVALVVVLAGVGWFVVTSRSGDETTQAAGTDATPAASNSPSASPSPSQTSTAGCGAPAKVTKKVETWPSAPDDTLASGKTYQIALDTNCGKVVIESDPAMVKAAPKTVNSQQFLATMGFFNGSDCFRLTTEGLYVLQCGSPTNDGSGGPGYQIPDENLPKDGTGNYPAGTVAMANSGPGTNGSQFFLVYKDTTLGPDYTIWGKVTTGLKVLKKVAKQGVQGGGTDGAPVQPLVITKATASSS
jgi:peptidyl-prolyl cis-trans isomerase B (cyclophilin B)